MFGVLGFKLKVHKKREKYVIELHIADKAVKKETENLIKRLKYIQNPRNKNEEATAINYYRFATHISLDCNKIQWQISTNRLKGQLKRTGSVLGKYTQKQHKKTSKCASLAECQFAQ